MSSLVRVEPKVTALPPAYRYDCSTILYEALLTGGWPREQANVAASSVDDILRQYRATPGLTKADVIQAVCTVIQDNTKALGLGVQS